MEDITTDTEEIQRIIRLYFKILTKLEILNEMEDFLDRYHFSGLNQDKVNNLNCSKTPKKIEAVIKSRRTKESTGPDGFSAEL